MTWFGNFLRRMNNATNPDTVLEVKTDRYVDRPIISREDGIFLYGMDETNKAYEIVFHKPCSESLTDGYRSKLVSVCFYALSILTFIKAFDHPCKLPCNRLGLKQDAWPKRLNKPILPEIEPCTESTDLYSFLQSQGIWGKAVRTSTVMYGPGGGMAGAILLAGRCSSEKILTYVYEEVTITKRKLKALRVAHSTRLFGDNEVYVILLFVLDEQKHNNLKPASVSADSPFPLETWMKENDLNWLSACRISLVDRDEVIAGDAVNVEDQKMIWVLIGKLLGHSLPEGLVFPETAQSVRLQLNCMCFLSLLSARHPVLTEQASRNIHGVEVGFMFDVCSNLLRIEDKDLAVMRFISLKDTLPLLCDASKTTNSLSSIQKFCDIILEHPTWNICHIVVNFNFLEALALPRISCHINTSDPETGVSPLQLAIQQSNLPMINKLLLNHANINHYDNVSNSVYHFAAITNKEIIMALDAVDESKAGLDHLNTFGQSPLHIACSEDKPECVVALLALGADANKSATKPRDGVQSQRAVMGDFVAGLQNKLMLEEMKNGGTPLHWCTSKEVINPLLDRNCEINALNFASMTALQVMIVHNRFECVVALLARDADISAADMDGNTALHLAVRNKNTPIIQALIAFGAELDYLNNAGFTPRHIAAGMLNEIGSKMVYTLHAVGANRCATVMESCTPECALNGAENGTPPPVAPGREPRVMSEYFMYECLGMMQNGSARGGRVLCMDGGGIRGLVLITILLHLEKALGRPIIHCFDWIAATSTGGILALALSAGQTLKNCLCLYFRLKDQAFNGFRPYNSEPLENLLKEVMGTDTTMSEIRHPKLLITGCLADRMPVDFHVFRNFESASELLSDYPVPKSTGPSFAPLPTWKEQLIWEAARATGAAPSYFRAYGRFIDGGLIANNPTMDALTEIHEYNTALRHVGRGSEAVEPSVVLSVGTGSVPTLASSNVDIFMPTKLWEAAKAVSCVFTMQSLLVDQATQADGRVIDRAQALCSMLKIPYFRFSPQLSENVGMDEKTDAKLVNMIWETRAYINSQSALVTKLVTLLNC